MVWVSDAMNNLGRLAAISDVISKLDRLAVVTAGDPEDPDA